MGIGEGVDDDLFAEDFEAAIGFAGDFFDCWIGECDLWALFGQDCIGFGLVIDRDGRYIEIEISVPLEQIAGGFGDSGGVAAHVDDGIEVLAGIEEFLDATEPVAGLLCQEGISIADEPTDGGWQTGISLGSVEEGDAVIGSDGLFDKGASRELGAAEDEDVHGRGYEADEILLRY